MYKYFVSFFLLFLPIYDVSSSDAYVFAEEDFGQGFFRQRGAECFFITAGHVVQDSTETELITSERYRYKAFVVTSYPDDVAILRVELPKNDVCPKSSWGSGKKLKSLLGIEQEGIIKTRLDDGSTLQTAVQIKTFDDYRYIQVVPKNKNDKFQKGFSGSPLFVAGELAGMLQSVSNGVGKVFRQDALNNTVALFFQKNKINKEVKEPTQSKENAPSIASVNKPKIFTGKIKKGQSVEHNIKGVANSPILFTLAKTSRSFQYTLKILKGKNVVYSNRYTSYQLIEHVFTPKKSGTYTVQLTGTSHYGEYSVSMEQIAAASDLTGKANVINIGESVDGQIAKGATAEYRFKATANSPLLFTLAKTSRSFQYTLKILKGKNVVYSNRYTSYQLIEHVFKPKKSGTYTLQLFGTSHYGEYSVSMEKAKIK